MIDFYNFTDIESILNKIILVNLNIDIRIVGLLCNRKYDIYFNREIRIKILNIKGELNNEFKERIYKIKNDDNNYIVIPVHMIKDVIDYERQLKIEKIKCKIKDL